MYTDIFKTAVSLVLYIYLQIKHQQLNFICYKIKKKLFMCKNNVEKKSFVYLQNTIVHKP